MSNHILPDFFVQSYECKDTPFKNYGLGEFVYLRTYSRIDDNGVNERWHETIARVINGVFSLKKEWFIEKNICWNSDRELQYAKKMYDLMFNVKFLPGGRGLWAMGTKITDIKHLYAPLNNCAFVSTDDIETSLAEPFTFLMDACMLGVGVGFDTKGAGKINIHRPDETRTITHRILDSREGWVHAVKLLLESFFLKNKSNIEFDYSAIRKAGEKLGCFGGISSGPEPLIVSVNKIRCVLSENVGMPLTSRTIVDIMNLIGLCVVSGNVRRSAEIALGEYDDDIFINLKNYEKYPERCEYGWISNNSIVGKLGMNYTDVANRIKMNGEPGIIWLDNMKNYSRMNNIIDMKDNKLCGTNPCSEISLESYEMCNLVENFLNRHQTLDELTHTLKYAFMYAKTVSLGMSHWERTNAVIARNRRIGMSLTGITNFITNNGINMLREWCHRGYDFIKLYDKRISAAYQIPESIKITCVKPSGTVSLLAPNTCPGLHYPMSTHYIRRVRISENSNLWRDMESRGYVVENGIREPFTKIINFPISLGNVRSVKNVSMWEQLELAALLQEVWADNQVSCTVTFNQNTESGDIANALNYFQYRLKGISFLPLFTDAYVQMPYEEITLEKYNELSGSVTATNNANDRINITEDDHEAELYCTTDKCIMENPKKRRKLN